MAGPHPVRGVAHFALSLPEGGPVRIIVYDVAGKRVRDLVNKALVAGTHPVDWDLRDDAGRKRSGVFFALVQAPSGTVTKRVIALP